MSVNIYIWATAWDSRQCGMCDQQRFRSACAYAQTDQSLCKSLEFSMTLRLLTGWHLEFLSLKGGYTARLESTLVKMTHCWKSHVICMFVQQVSLVHVCWLCNMFAGPCGTPEANTLEQLCVYKPCGSRLPCLYCRLILKHFTFSLVREV